MTLFNILGIVVVPISFHPFCSFQTGLVGIGAFDKSLRGPGRSSLASVVCKSTGSSGRKNSQAPFAVVSSGPASHQEVSLGSGSSISSARLAF